MTTSTFSIFDNFTAWVRFVNRYRVEIGEQNIDNALTHYNASRDVAGTTIIFQTEKDKMCFLLKYS
jgi:hypothetical protein